MFLRSKIYAYCSIETLASKIVKLNKNELYLVRFGEILKLGREIKVRFG